jgi:hypothetical protein
MRLGEQRGELGVIGWVVVLAVVGALVAIPYVFMTKQEANDAQTAVGAASRASDVAAETSLTDAIRVPQTLFVSDGSLTGFSPQQAAAEEPQIRWGSTPTAVAGTISIRGADASSVALVTLGATGPLCIAFDGGVVTYGHADAANASECAGTSW